MSRILTRAYYVRATINRRGGQQETTKKRWRKITELITTRYHLFFYHVTNGRPECRSHAMRALWALAEVLIVIAGSRTRRATGSKGDNVRIDHPGRCSERKQKTNKCEHLSTRTKSAWYVPKNKTDTAHTNLHPESRILSANEEIRDLHIVVSPHRIDPLSRESGVTE